MKDPVIYFNNSLSDDKHKSLKTNDYKTEHFKGNKLTF